MKKQSVVRKAARTRHKVDEQLKEFEGRDLGADIRRSGAARVIRRRTTATSILLEEDLVTALRKKAAKRGLGYQTMLKMIVREHLDEY